MPQIIGRVVAEVVARVIAGKTKPTPERHVALNGGLLKIEIRPQS